MEALVKKGELGSIQLLRCYKKADYKSYTGKEKFLEEIPPTAEIAPAVNQLERHLYNPQLSTSGRTRSSRRHTPPCDQPTPRCIRMSLLPQSRRSTGSRRRVLLGYLLTQDVVIPPKLVTPARITSNYIGTVAAV
ncbi:hypothetical protein FIBSPDRAFT_948813 [Athelia psychrophila]|uniref:Uncharacterized protein n=1 Tax=Athelia psychrophila TaxID=1759441 RepID=A0A166QI42_9AGAM|nr:hypothetical protein FIBSPDRAFT_948813 [Fibularhizoctonia sp. CBS 109695]